MEGQGILIGIIIFLGVIIICIGLYIQKTKTYHLIAGYNSLSQEEKWNLDINKFALIFRNVFLLMGFIMIITYPVLLFFNLETYLSLAVFFIIISGVLFLKYKGQVYFKKNKSQ